MLTSILFVTVLFGADASHAAQSDLKSAFENPPIEYWPRTRWWWMGNAHTLNDIEWELREMHAHGIGGVEQITMEAMYERGGHPFLSAGHIEQLKHGIAVARELGMEFSLNFGGPGWVWGGDWIPPEEQNQCLIASSVDIAGPAEYTADLPTAAVINPKEVDRSVKHVLPEDRLVAVVAGQVKNGSIARDSLVVLTDRVTNRSLRWSAPEGTWRLMAFWLTTPEKGVLDHINKDAVAAYCEHVGGAFRSAFGEDFGKTVETMFQDSFELPIHRNGLYWNQHMLGRFRARMGYDVTPFLPALWFEIDDTSPRIRYDVNKFVNDIGFEAFFDTFLGWCEANGVKGRIQPYGFPTDVLEGAGRSHIPELEITAGEKDAVPWFDTRIGPRDYTASGAHLYGRNVISVEAYTYLHWEPFRETLEELKIASDQFLTAGANKFYNSGFAGSPERTLGPTRDFYSAIRIDDRNTLWPYYPQLSSYVSRCCLLLRQGHPMADVAVYSPLANQWAKDALNPRRWTRDFDWGGLGKLIVANGYDFDLINDDVLVNRSRFADGTIVVQNNAYRVLILPNVESIPVETYERIAEYVESGGHVLALERVPHSSTGFKDHERMDMRVRELSHTLFEQKQGLDAVGRRAVGNGHAYTVNAVMHRIDPLDWRSTLLDPFVNTLRSIVSPDLGIDFATEGLRENGGLTFVHRRDGERDIYFVSNVQDKAIDYDLAFRVTGKRPWLWSPYSGAVRPVHVFVDEGGLTRIPMRLAPFESAFVVFEQGTLPVHATHSTFDEIVAINNDAITARASRNGVHTITLSDTGRSVETVVNGVPAPMLVDGTWEIAFPGRPPVRTNVLDSWTDLLDTRHFSGTVEYRLTFELPAAYVAENIHAVLDLGAVWNIAEVTLNDANAGTRWMRGQMLDITSAVKPGVNVLVVRVTNTLINRISGWDAMPPVPEALRSRLGLGTQDARHPANALLRWEPLPPSGLLGPVQVVFSKAIRVPFP